MFLLYFAFWARYNGLDIGRIKIFNSFLGYVGFDNRYNMGITTFGSRVCNVVVVYFGLIRVSQ